jgi:hypothetical protein
MLIDFCWGARSAIFFASGLYHTADFLNFELEFLIFNFLNTKSFSCYGKIGERVLYFYL